MYFCLIFNSFLQFLLNKKWEFSEVFIILNYYYVKRHLAVIIKILKFKHKRHLCEDLFSVSNDLFSAKIESICESFLNFQGIGFKVGVDAPILK